MTVVSSEAALDLEASSISVPVCGDLRLLLRTYKTEI